MGDEVLRILLVEDNPQDVLFLSESLTGAFAGKFKLQQVERISSALKLTDRVQFDIILLDLTLPDSNGLDTIDRICATDLSIPVIVLNDLEDDELALKAVQHGVQDYLVKDQIAGNCLTRVIFHAIERKRMIERLKYMATHDELTGLPNRALFYDRLHHALARADRNKDKSGEYWKVALMLLDLDDFKIINDTLGHTKGDQVLRLVAERLCGCLRESDTIARLGGDEFAILIEGTAASQDCAKVAQKIIDSINIPFDFDGSEHQLGISIGISQYPADGTNGDTMLKHADIAMYQAKNYKNTYKLYEDLKESEWNHL